MSKNILKQVRTKTLNWVIGATLMFTPAVSFGQAELPFTMTEAALNEGVNVTASGKATPYWDSNYNGIHFGGSGAFSSSGGWDWDDKYVIIKLKDIPKALIFSGDQSGAATGVEWYVATSEDGSDYTNVIWSSTSKPSNKRLDLPESAKFVKICYSGNLEGWIYDVSIEAKYCTFKVISDGVIKITESIKPNYPIPAVDNNQTKECHTFSGWDKEIPTIMPNEDFTLTALFNVIKYTSHFKIKNEELGVTMLEDFDISFDCGKPLDVDTPKHEGVKFKEWQPELPSIADELIEGATYTAQWELLDFPVYITITEDSIIEKRFLYGEQVVIEEPQLKGYTFRQWSPNPPSKMPAEAIEIEAIFDPNNYPFILNKGYETTPAADTTKYTYKESIGNIKTPSREGYTFIGWNPEIPATMPADTFRTTAQWEVNQYRHVVYTSETDSVETLVNYGETLEPLAEQSKEGYTFKGWDIEQPATMPANDLIIRAIWEVNSYKLELYDGDVLYKAYTFNYNDSIKFEDYQEPTKVGYTFKGWNEEFPEVMPAEDLKYKAKWSINQYRHVVYASENDSIEKIVTFGDTLNLLPEPTKEGYTFRGWDKEQPETMPANDLVIRAIWEVNSYKLELYDGEELLKAYTFNYNDSIKLEDFQEPTKVGYTFNGWDSTLAKVMPAKDLKYTAEWKVNQYRLVVYTSETDSTEKFINYGDTVKAVEPGTKEGHSFKAWDKEFPVTMPAENVTIHAIWEVNQYTITFLVDNAEYQSYRFDFDSLIVLDGYKDPTKEGYTFNGWGAEIPERMPAKNLTIEAQWIINEYNITWVIDPNKPETNHTTSVEFGAAIKQDIPTMEGHSFVEWKDVPATMPAKDITITAVWNINRYKLNFYSDGALYLKQVYEYDETIDYASIPTPVKEGYKFLGWSEKPTKMPAEDDTITAKWAINEHELVIVTDKENPSTNDTIYYEFGAKIESIETPEKEGYSFLGWDAKIPETMPDNSVVITAQWSINSYTLTTLINCVPTTYTYTFGDSITLADPFVEGYDFVKWTQEMPKVMPGQNLLMIADMQLKQYNLIINSDKKSDTLIYNFNEAIAEVKTPEKEGHTFMGWSEAIPETMPAKDLTIDALWETNFYKVHYLSDGDTLLSTTCKFGETINKPNTPTKTGHTFAKWYVEGGVIPASMPANDLTFEAIWDVNSYYLVAIGNNDTTSQKYKYMEEIAEMTIPTRKGYTFAEWNKEIPNKMPAYNDTVRALWDINSYNVTWIVDEDSTTITYDYQEAIKKEKNPEKVGYTFIGWDQFIAETMPDKDLFYTAQFDVNNYQFIIHADDKEEVVSYPYNNEITHPEDPTKEGHTFTGWSETIPAKMPAHDVEVFAQFSPDTFHLNIKVEDDTIIYNYPYGSEIQTIIAPVIAGKEFDRWSEGLPSTMPAYDITIEALYKANSYQLTIITGEETEIKNYQFGEEVEKPAEPTKKGYTFVGWDAEYPTVMPNKNVVVTAQWKANVYDFVVIVGEDTTTTAYTYNETIKKTATPEKEGYIFEGWDIEIPYSMPAKNVTIEAKFVVAEFTLTTIVENIKTEVIYDFGQEINTPKKPTRKGYTFKGWSVEIPETMPARDIVAEAKWEVNQYNLMVIVDEDTTTTTYDYNSIIEKPTTPEKEGYIFVGWNTEIPYTMPAEDVTIEAEFAIDEFRFKTIVEGAISEETYKFGEEIKAPKEPTREGYTFKGWSIEIPETMPAKDIVAEAEWEVNQYTVTFIADKDTVQTDKYDFGANVEEISIGDKEGYTFVGWDAKVPSQMPAKDLTFHAVWEAKKYNFVYEIEGEVFTYEYSFGDTIKLPDTPTRTGYTFIGWSKEIPSIMGDRNIVINAQWRVNKYAVTRTIDGVTKTDSVAFGEHLDIETPVKTGCAFKGWDIEVPENMPAKNLKMVAKFEPLGKLMTWTEDEKLFVTGLAEDVEIFIYDWTGKVLYNGKEREIELPTGVYIIQANEEYKKVVVQ